MAARTTGSVKSPPRSLTLRNTRTMCNEAFSDFLDEFKYEYAAALAKDPPKDLDVPAPKPRG